MALQSISEYCSQLNPPGLITIEYLPTAWIDSANYERIVNSSRNWQYDIPLVVGGEWLTAPVIRDGRIWDEQPRTDAQGTAYEQIVSGITPKLRPEVTDQFEQMDGYTYVIRLKDKTGQYWLIGTLANPLAFVASATSGSGSRRNEYSLRFSNLTSRRAFGFVPEF